MNRKWNPRFLAYCQESGMTPDEQIEHDNKLYPGGSMCGFIVWIGEKIRIYKEKFPEERRETCILADQESFIKYLFGKGE